MKKIFLPIAIAAALFCGNNASAVIPAWYNYQGAVNKAGETISLSVEIRNSADEVVYNENHSTTTNASGLFNIHIGEGEVVAGAMPTPNELAADQFTLNIKVNGNIIAECPFAAVPYATVAKAIEGVDSETLANMSDDVAYVLDNVVSLQEGYRNVANVADVEALADGLEMTQQDVLNLVEGQKENTAAIAILEQYAEGQVETNDTFGLGIGQLANGLDEAEAKTEELFEGLNITQEDVMNLTTGVRENSVDIALLKQYVEGLQEGAETDALGFTQLNNVVNALAEEVQINSDALANAENEIMKLTTGQHENLIGINKNKTDIEALADGLAITQDDVLNLSEGAKGDHAAIEILNQYVEGLMENTETMATGFTQLSNAVNEIEANVETNAQGIADAQNEIINLTEGHKEASVGISLAKQNLDNIDEALANATSDIQGVQERMRELATVESVETLANGLSVTEGNVIELTEGLKEVNVAISKFQELIEGHFTDYDSLYKLVETQTVSIETLQRRVNMLDR